MPGRSALDGIRRLVTAALGLTAAACASICALMAWLWFDGSRYAYNGQGRYFDGVVVHEDMTDVTRAGFFVFLLTAVFVWLLRRSLIRRQADEPAR